MIIINKCFGVDGACTGVKDHPIHRPPVRYAYWVLALEILTCSSVRDERDENVNGHTRTKGKRR
jgi:hypothetical protein